jgi:hypothetical protein
MESLDEAGFTALDQAVLKGEAEMALPQTDKASTHARTRIGCFSEPVIEVPQTTGPSE